MPMESCSSQALSRAVPLPPNPSLKLTPCGMQLSSNLRPQEHPQTRLMKHAVIGTIEVKPGTRAEVLRAVLAHRERSLRDEPGTLQFEVLVPNDDANKILLFELYADTQAFEEHFYRGESIARTKKEVGHLMASLTGVHSKLGGELAASGTVEQQTVIPQLRIASASRSLEFYVGGLGFTVDWKHQFEPGFPLFVRLTRTGQTIFLTEHVGDCEVGGAVYFVVPDVDRCYAEFSGRGVSAAEPPTETSWGTREMTITDPDGNRLRFASERSSG